MKFYVLQFKKSPNSVPGVAKSYTSEYTLISEKKLAVNARHSISILKFMVHLSFTTQ